MHCTLFEDRTDIWTEKNGRKPEFDHVCTFNSMNFFRKIIDKI